jgi:hypothetical protein
MVQMIQMVLMVQHQMIQMIHQQNQMKLTNQFNWFSKVLSLPQSRNMLEPHHQAISIQATLTTYGLLLLL